MTNDPNATTAARKHESVANYVSRLPPEAFERMTRRADPKERGLRNAQAVFWMGMAVAMVVMVHSNDFL